jgi:hypothetical protein
MNGQKPMIIVLENVRPPSWNNLKRMNKHDWHHQVLEAQILMRAAIGPIPQYFTGRVDISVTVYFDRYPYDSSNIPAKLYEDGLKGMVIPDDRPQYVRQVSTESVVDRKRPRVEIAITPVAEED